MAQFIQSDDGKKKTTTVSVGGRDVTVNTPKPQATTTTQTVSVGGRDINVQVPVTNTKTTTPKTTTPKATNTVYVGGRDITPQVTQQIKNEALNVPKSNPVVDKVKSVFNDIAQKAGVETGRMKLKNDYTAQRQQAKLDKVNQENRDLVQNMTADEFKMIYTDDGQRRDNSQTINAIKNEMAKLDQRIAEIGNDDMAIAEISKRNELQQQLDAFDELDKKAQALEELNAQEWYRQNGDEESLRSYQEMLSHKNDNIFQRGANALNHLGNTTANVLPTAFDQMKELGSSKMARDSIATLEDMHNNGEIDDDTYRETLSEWQDYIDRHKSTNSDNLSQIIRANADRLSANTYYGASDVEKFCLQAGESTAQFLLHFAIGQAIAGAAFSTETILAAGVESATEQLGAEAVAGMTRQALMKYGTAALGGNIATVSMSMASGTDKMNQLLMEGVDPQTAAQNGLMTGLVSYATEKIGMDRFVNMMGTPFSADAFGSILLNQLKGGLSEGLEEVAEGLVDPLIDSVTLGTPYEVNGDELKMEFLLGGASGLAMGVGSTVIGTVRDAKNINALLNERRDVRAGVLNEIVRANSENRLGTLVVNTQLQKNLLTNEIDMLKKHYSTMTEVQKRVADELIAKGNNAIRTYDEKIVVPGVTFSSDIPQTTTTEENDKAIFETYTPDFNNEVQFEKKVKETEDMVNNLLTDQLAIDELTNETQQILNENGYNIDSKVFNSLNEDQQKKALVALDFANIMGLNVNVTNSLPSGVNGFVDGKGNITIDGTKNPVLFTLTHELTHGTESSKFYPALKKLVMDSIGGDWNSIVNQKIADYKQGNIDLDFENAEKEVVARYVEDKLGDEAFIDNLIKYNYSIASKILQDLKAFGSDDEIDQIRNTFEKAFADNYQNNREAFSFEKESDFDKNEYNRATDIKNELTSEEINAIRNNLMFNSARGLGVTYVPGKAVTVYANGNGDFKVLRYNEIDDRQTVGTLNRRNDETINSGALAGSGDFGNGFSSSLYKNDELVGEEQGSGLQFDGFGERTKQNRRNTRNRPLTDKEYRSLAENYLRRNGGTRFSYDQEEAKAIKESAVNEFGTTGDYMKAGYILDDGQYLDLSEEQPTRTQDHRSVGVLFDGLDYARDGMNAGMIKFMNEGNIRVQPESGGLDISNVVEPTYEQYSTIRDFLRNYNDEWHVLDMSGEDGRAIFSVEYPPYTSAQRVVNDIKQYFEDGTIPEVDDQMADFRYSFDPENVNDSYDNKGDKVNPKMVEYMRGTKLTDEDGNLMRIYHTSPKMFEEFDPTGTEHYRFGNRIVNYFSSDPIVSGSYTNDDFVEVTNGEPFKKYLEGLKKAGEIKNAKDAKYKEWREREYELDQKMRKEFSKREDEITPSIYKLLDEINKSNMFSFENDPLMLGVGSGYNPVLRDFIESQLNGILNWGVPSKIAAIENLKEIVETKKYQDYAVAQEVVDLLNPITEIDSTELSNLRKLYRSETMRLSSEHDKLLNEYDRIIREIDTDKGKQYVGYGRAFSPYVLNSSHGNTNWNSINMGDFRIDRETHERIARDIVSIFDNIPLDNFDYVTKTKDRVNRLIISNVDDETLAYLAENPIVLANYTNAVRDAVSGRMGAISGAGLAQKMMQWTNNALKGVLDNNLNDDGYRFKNSLETNDVVKAVLAINEYTDGRFGLYDGVVFKNITDSASSNANGINSDVIALFSSNQFKLIGNENPTEDASVRYSFDEEAQNSVPTDGLDSVVSDLAVSDDELPIRTVMPTPSRVNSVATVLSEAPAPKSPTDVKRRFKSLAKWFITDTNNGIMDFADEVKNERIKDLADYAMTSRSRALTAIYDGIYDNEGKKKIGKSLVEIKGALPKELSNLFDEYMYHYRNIDDMSMRERMGDEFKDRPVFGESVTADDSLQRVMEIEEQHPEFKQMAEDIWEYTRTLLKKQIGGIVSQEDYDNFQKMRPHYVPISRNVDKTKGKGKTDPNRVILKFKGSTIDINPLDYALMQYTQRSYDSFDKNNLYREIINAMGGGEEVNTDTMKSVEENIESARKTDSGHELIAYIDGKQVAVPISEDMYRSIQNKRMPDYVTKALEPMAKINQIRKSLITSLNPFFGIRNAAKDIQDASFNTHYPKTFLKNYREAVSQIAHEGEVYKQFKRLGGTMSNYTADDLATAFEKMKSDTGMVKKINRLLGLNDDIETAPRLAEFISSLEAGNTVEKALYDAAEVTTNFKRGGAGTKFADKYLGFTFLNASVQGYDKHVRESKRNFTKARANGIRGVITLMAKLVLASGLPLRLLQEFYWKDDDDYQELSDYIKNNYYIYWKTKDGKFLRINKGRIAAFYQTALINGYKTVTRQANVWDALLDDATSFFDNIAPNNPLDNNIYSPLWQAYNNKTWYGDPIVSETLQDNNEKWEQYDEGTDLLSKKIGELSKKVADVTGSDIFQLSPKKINYVLDQYSGIAGDLTLPALTPKTDVETDNPLLKGVTSSFLNDFTTDPVLKNQKVTDFFALRDELNKKKKKICGKRTVSQVYERCLQ